jgi:hypothetical protein
MSISGEFQRARSCTYDRPFGPPGTQCINYMDSNTISGQWCDSVPMYYPGTTVYNMAVVGGDLRDYRRAPVPRADAEAPREE